MLPATMRAAYISERGDPDSITVGPLPVPVPVPGPTDVLVRVDVAPVNQVDTYIRSGRYPTRLPMPFVIGRDLVGTVAEAGPGSGFGRGERVWCNSLGHNGRQGSFAEFAVVPADRLYRLPDAAAPVAAVACFHPAATAYLGLHRRLRVEAGQVLLVGGAAGSVGACVVQFAVEAGLRVLATARPADFDYVRNLGAEAVFDYADPGLTDQVLAAAPDGVDVHWDTSGRTPLREITPRLAVGARIVVTAGRAAQREVELWPLYTRDVTVVGFVISLATAADLAAAAQAINRRLAGPGLAVRVSQVLPLDQAAQAHRLVESGVRGRVVVRVREESLT